MKHRVAVLAVPPVVGFDLTIPGIVLGSARVGGERVYDVTLHAAEPGPMRTTTGDLTLVVEHGLDDLTAAGTLIVPGTHARREGDVCPRTLDALRRAHAEGRRVVSICTGAFVLALAGLLDGRPATTHWIRADLFGSEFPDVRLDPRVLYIDDGQVLTSAGLAAGIDLCLHLIRRDFGASVANDVARYMVVSPVRPGGQAQFITSPLPETDDLSLAATRAWALERLDRRLTLEDLARHARVSVRTLSRRFRAETGLAPLRWLLDRRVERARELLEATSLSVEEVARFSGLGSADSLRAHLVRHSGLTPTAYRTAFAHAGPRPG